MGTVVMASGSPATGASAVDGMRPAPQVPSNELGYGPKTPGNGIARVRLMGMPVSAVTERQAIDHVVDESLARRGGWVITPNLDQLRQYHARKELRPMFEDASLVLADGMPLIWASRIQRTPLPERVPGSELIFTLTKAAAERGLSVFFLGGNPGAADACAAKLRELNPDLKVAGTYCPPFGFDQNPAEYRKVEAALRSAEPDLIYVGLGFPKQELAIERLRPLLPGAWFAGIGISFSFVAGEVRRAPRWMQRVGLEWVHRLVQEPGRLFKRYVIHNIPFAARLFVGVWWARIRGKN